MALPVSPLSATTAVTAADLFERYDPGHFRREFVGCKVPGDIYIFQPFHASSGYELRQQEEQQQQQSNTPGVD